jgi:glycosyltransferase involved in cell wall biosynthesis
MLSIIIPAHNEAEAISATITEIQQVLETADLSAYEIIVVDDGSADETAILAKAAGAKVISHPHNIGYGQALKTGIRSATYDTIVITDADMTYPFTEVPKLLTHYHKGFDMVVGARQGMHYIESWQKKCLRRMLRFIVEFSASRKIPDINSGLRIFSKQTILPYFNHLCDTFSFTTSMTLAYMMTARFVSYVEIPYRKRAGKTKVKLLKDSLKTLQYILQAINYYNPIRLYLLFAVACILMSIPLFLIAFITHLHTAFYLGIGSILSSIIVLCFGLNSDLLKQIMNK